jgi:hypothetical protein
MQFIFKRLISPATISRYYNDEKATNLKTWFSKSLSIFKAKTLKGSEDGILLVQIVRDFDFTIKLAGASKVLAEKHNLLVRFHDVQIHWTVKMRRLEQLFDFFNLSSIKNVYSSFGGAIVFKNDHKYRDQELIKSRLKQIKVDLYEKGVLEVLLLKFEDVEVGDLIYDSYLRFYSKPTITEIDEDLLFIIEKALNIFYGFREFLESRSIKCLLNTYVSYIHHGITARLCLASDIPVYTVGYNNYLIQRVTKEFPYHQINHTEFDPQRELNSEQRELAKMEFTSRFSGKIDSATAYMRSSAYSDGKINKRYIEQLAYNSRNIIIYAHDFYDSPHINRQLLYPDFYQYLKEALQAVSSLTGTGVFIKIHPNGMPGSKEKLIDLVLSYNKDHFFILDESTSNNQIIESKPDLVATARGTIGIEMAYFNVPTVALFDNIYSNFKFVHTCYDREIYYSILRGEKEPQIEFNREAIYRFYYQAYLEKTIREENNIFAEIRAFKGPSYSNDFLEFLSHTQFINSRDKLLTFYSNALIE